MHKTLVHFLIIIILSISACNFKNRMQKAASSILWIVSLQLDQKLLKKLLISCPTFSTVECLSWENIFLIFIFQKRGVKSETVAVGDDWRGIETLVSKEKPNTANIIENPFWFRLCQYKSNHKRKTNNRKTSYEQRNHKIKSIQTKSRNRFWLAGEMNARGKTYEVKDLRKTNHARAFACLPRSYARLWRHSVASIGPQLHIEIKFAIRALKCKQKLTTR